MQSAPWLPSPVVAGVTVDDVVAGLADDDVVATVAVDGVATGLVLSLAAQSYRMTSRSVRPRPWVKSPQADTVGLIDPLSR
jgi:hypothetical protein